MPSGTGTPSVSEFQTPSSGVSRPLQKNLQSQSEQRQLVPLWATGTLSANVMLLALVVAFGLGVLHALSPGHGKTAVGSYLVGSRGTAKHAILLGTIVTVSHTLGVFILGLITLYTSKYFFPERLYPWLGFASGLAVMVIGLNLLLQRYLSLRAHARPLHTHNPSNSRHSTHPHSHDDSNAQFKDLLALGMSGGFVPCPSALIVLLIAISLNRVGLGLLLIAAFSFGLALVLIAMGLMRVYPRCFTERFSRNSHLWQIVPVFFSLVVVMLGTLIALQPLVSAGIVRLHLSVLK